MYFNTREALENIEKFQNISNENVEFENLLEFKFITYENTSAFSISIDFCKKAIWDILCFDEQSEAFSSYSDIKPVYEIHRLDHMKFSKLKQDNLENTASNFISFIFSDCDKPCKLSTATRPARLSDTFFIR